METPPTIRFDWIGSEAPFLDKPHTVRFGNVVVGRYGGFSDSVATTNEDGALVWVDTAGRWEFAIILDAHASADSASLVMSAMIDIEPEILDALSRPTPQAIPTIEHRILTLFGSTGFREECRRLRGETACLITVRIEQYLWWLNIGDCMLFLHHPELSAFGQSMLNQRNFFEWIGEVNTFDLPVPCYSSGRRQMRQGRNVILMATDGLLHGGDPAVFTCNPLNDEGLEQMVDEQLRHVQRQRGADSATIVAWVYDNPVAAIQPTA